MKRIPLSLLLAALLVPATGTAKTVPQKGVESFCGTRVSTSAISHARHRFNEWRRVNAPGQQQQQQPGNWAVGTSASPTGPDGMKGAAGVTVKKLKNIAVIEDNGTIFPPPNLFDLNGGGVQFKGGGGGKTRAEPFSDFVSSNRGDRIEIGDDDNLAIDLPFSFSFYGKSYTRVFLNSDGNLTFGRAESSSLPRSLSRFLEGPPRIAVDFVDLDPSVTSGEAGVYLLNRSDMVRVTWLDVPRWDESDSNTLQVTLYPNGRITMSFDVEAEEGIVGVSPGGPGTINLVDLSRQLPVPPKSDAIAEQFRAVPEIDDLAASKAVLSAVRDEYDVIVLFADFEVDLDGAFAYNAPVKNEIRGIGDGIYDISSLYGSKGRLRAFVQMGSLANYPAGPNNHIALSEATGIGILAHEVAHRWLAFPTFIDRDGQRSNDLLGRQLAHWSFNLDTDGSVMEGNDIRDNGNGTFTTTGSWQGFSPLDEYLMGLRRKDQVRRFFYVSGSAQDNDSAPDTGVTLTGERIDVNINQIIASIGPRVPAMTTKPTQVAFALLGRQGEPPSLDSVRKVNQYRNRLSTFYRQETEDRGRIATWLRFRKPAAVAAAAGVVSTPAESEAAVAAPESAENETERRARRQLRKRFDHVDELR